MEKLKDLLGQINAVKKVSLLIIIVVVFSGCCTLKSPLKKYECQKARAEEKIIVLTKRFPELLQPVDTISIYDTIRINNIKVDTTFIENNVIDLDTVFIEKDKIKIQYVKKDSLVYISGECIEDTIFIEKQIPIEKIVVQKPTFAKQAKDWFWLLILLFTGGFIISRLASKFRLF